MDPDSYAALIEALATGEVTFSRDVMTGNTSWTTPAKFKWGDSEVVGEDSVETLTVTVAANTPWRPLIGQTFIIVDDVVAGRVFSVSKVTPTGKKIVKSYKVVGQA